MLRVARRWSLVAAAQTVDGRPRATNDGRRATPRLGRRGVVLGCLLAVASAHAEPCTSTATCLAALDAAQAETRALRARFVQTKHVSLLDQPLVSRGRFAFARPDRMRIDVESPQPSTILIDGRDVAIPGLPASERQALAASPLAAMFTELGALFAGSTRALAAHFAVEAAPAADGIRVALTPTEPSWRELFTRMELRFAGPHLTIRAMRLDDSLGDRLEIEMTDVERNPDLPDALFEPTPGGT